jgi:hypothetical protein
MKTKKSKTIKNKTVKNNKSLKPSLKVLKVSYPLYASKKHEGDKLLEYKMNAEKHASDHCLLDNSSWFGDLEVAKSYKKNDTQIYKWKIKKQTYLLNINKENENFINYIFNNTTLTLTPTIKLTAQQIKNIEYNHEYINMSPNEKSLFEFMFAFGYITVKEQFEFLNLVSYLIKNNFIKFDTRDGDSILKKLNFKINYYKVSNLLSKKEKYNRISFYFFDKYAIMNLCKVVYNKKNYKISGVYQKNDTSFWFPNLIVYKMNIQEYILFNPHHNLVYEKLIE